MSHPSRGGAIAAVLIRADVVDAPLSADEARAAAAHAACGAVVVFSGDVRNHDVGKPVARLDYSGHPDAGRVLAEVVAGFADRAGVHTLWAAHRVGHLEIGDAALVVAVGAEHRGQAFAAASDLVDEIKARVPIWKNQFFADGTHEWSNCP